MMTTLLVMTFDLSAVWVQVLLVLTKVGAGNKGIWPQPDYICPADARKDAGMACAGVGSHLMQPNNLKVMQTQQITEQVSLRVALQN